MNCRIFNLPDRLFHQCYPENDGVIRILISPDEFLRLAGFPANWTKWDASLVEQWQECPQLIIDPETGIIHGHEGRHRIAALRQEGYWRVEIVAEICPDPSRFGCSVEKMLAWEWDGKLPQWKDCIPQAEWLA